MTGAKTDTEQDRIDVEASDWLVMIEETALPPHRQREFDAWRAADPRHATTYAEMRAIWDEIPALTGLAHLAPMAPAPLTPVTLPPVLSPGALRPAVTLRPRRLAIGALSAAAAVAFVAVPPALYRPLPHYATALGEIRTLRLPDGSMVVLGARSTIALNFTARERRVILKGGEAYFEVVHNAARPFAVEAGDSIVRDVGTKFNVNVTDGSIRVAVVEGRVAVASRDAPGGTPKQLHAGQRLELLAGQSDTPSQDRPEGASAAPVTPMAWREGRLVYDNVRLADLAADVNRYYAPGITLVGAKVGDVRVTASFRTGEIPAFMTALDAALPVRAERQASGAFVVRSADR